MDLILFWFIHLYDGNLSCVISFRQKNFTSLFSVVKLPKRPIDIQTQFPAENRNDLIGKIEDKIWTAIFTRRVYAIRIISVRRARKKETKLYERK
jgi:uncharacterized DUF497 family protein